MILTYRRDFRDHVLNNPDRTIRLSRYKITEKSFSEDQLMSLSVPELTQGSSPTIGYYEFSTITDPSEGLQISLIPNASDVGVELTKTVLFFWEDLETSAVDLAFSVSLGPGEVLRRVTNLIDIPGFNADCNIQYYQSTDTSRLEGAGQGRYCNIWGEQEQNSYITLESWEAYDLEQRCTDETGHDYTVFMDRYGLKIY